jgi:hypothetical protein
MCEHAGRRSAVAIRHLRTSVIAAAVLGLSGVTLAGDSPTPEPSAHAASPCDTPQHHQFDFWVGDWQVFEANSNQLVAFDRVEKHSQGCIVQQNLTFITDMFRRPGVGYRLAGIGVNRFDGEGWLELWADNQWGAIVLRGKPDANGSMVLTSIIPSRNRDLRLVWEKRPDGSVRNL